MELMPVEEIEALVDVVRIAARLTIDDKTREGLEKALSTFEDSP